MDGFTYTNIFETKGIEYLAIIAFLILLIPFWIILNQRVEIKRQISRAFRALTASILRVPKGLFYSRNHTWAFLERSGVATVGVDDLLVHLTGEMKFRNLMEPGDPILKGEPIAEFEQAGKKLKIHSPVSGVVKGYNTLLAKDPELLTSDPYGHGWLYRIEPSDWKSDTSALYVAGETPGWFRNELDRFKDFISVTMPKYSGEHAMTVLQDGGLLADRSLAGLPNEVWEDFQREFLDPVK